MKWLLLLSVMLAAFMLFGCVFPLPHDDKAIAAQEATISTNMANAETLLQFNEQDQLASLQPRYQNYSAEIGAACDRLDALDSDKTARTTDAKAVCENQKSLDNCFYQLEKIKLQVKNSDTNINLDSLDVLCTDLRTLNLQDNLQSFETGYKNYTAWLNAENDISAKWDALTAFFSNTSSTPESNGAKMSDYYNDYKAQSAQAQASLQSIKTDCALKDGYKATTDKVGKACSNVDGYISDLGKADTIVLDMVNFFSQFESGTVTVDSTFIGQCDQVSAEYSRL